MEMGRGKRSCLVVEDSPTMAQLLSFALARIEATEVTLAAHGAEAIRMLADARFDLVVADVNMPIVDGLKLVRHIRAHDLHRHVPIIITTVEGARADRERALELGADAYMVKPIQAARLVAKARALMRPERARLASL